MLDWKRSQVPGLITGIKRIRWSRFSKRHRRLVEVGGMSLVLMAWGLNWVSVDNWNGATASYQRQVDKIVTGYHSVQTTANIVLESAITRATAAATEDQYDTENQPYQRVWSSGDVRRGWFQRTMNDVAHLRFFIDAIREADGEYAFGLGDRAKDLDAELTPIENKMQSLLGSRRGWVAAPAFDLKLLSASEAFKIEQSAEQLVERIFSLHGEALDAFAKRKKQWTWFYAGAFFIGTLMLISSKLLEWYFDPVSGDALPADASPGSQSALIAASVSAARARVPKITGTSRK